MENLTPEELRNICLTIITIIGFILQVCKKWKARREEAKYRVTRGKKKFQPKKWTPDGWYYDEKKQKWVGPDYPHNKG